MSVRLSCPSCNTAFALDAVPADRRANCPRCGDVFPIRGFTPVSDEEKTETSGEVASLFANPATQNPKAGLSPLRAVLIALALGFLGLAAGLTVYYTRKTKPEPQPQPEPPITAEVTPPRKLIGLGYLPAECNVIFATQPGPIIAYATRTKQDPHELLIHAGVPQQVFASLDQVGLTLPQIDHIAGGICFGDEGEDLRIAFALVLKQPLTNEEAFLNKLKAKPAEGKKSRWSIDLNRLPVSPMLAKVSPTVWVLGLNERDLVAVDKGGYEPGGAQFRGSESEGVQKMIASVPPDAVVWIVADDDHDWMQKPLVKITAQSPEAKKGMLTWLPAIKNGRGGLIALSFGEKPRLRLFVRTVDAATADHVRAYFQSRAAEMESATAGGGGVFAMFDAPFDPATSLPILQRFLTDAAK